MGLEVATYVSDLVATNPATSDPLAQGDDHIRLMKAALKASFPLVNGPLNATMVPFTPVGGLSATTVEGALAELDSEKLGANPALGTPVSGNLANCTFPTLNQNTTGTAQTATTIADGAVSTAAKVAANVVTNAKLARAGTAGQVLTSGGAGADPTWGDLPAGGVTSVGGNTGAVTNAQVAAAATAGYGYTPANGASYLLKDFGSGGGIGSFAICGVDKTLGSGGWAPGETNPAGKTIYSLPAMTNGAGVAITGTWRNVSGWNSNGDGAGVIYTYCIAQRIA